MSRKTLKQKLRKQTRDLKNMLVVQHEHAGLTINFEQRKLQAIAMGHGVMATLLSVKKELEAEGIDFENDPAYQRIEKTAQIRMSQCFATLAQLGISTDEINSAFQRGY